MVFVSELYPSSLNSLVEANNYSLDIQGQYKSRLWDIPHGYDANKACQYMPIEIHNKVFDHPDICESHVSMPMPLLFPFSP